jgi:guanosine-3',5'-bis(diphosphate) 3'-pyrophosphohydrolase
VQELIDAFGPTVAALVQEVTDDKTLPKAERKRLQIEHAAHLSPKASAIKLADLTANLRDLVERPPSWDARRLRAYFDWSKEVIEQLRVPPAGLRAIFDTTHSGV